MQHEEANLSVDLEQIASANVTEFLRVNGVHPERILVSNLVQQFRVAGTCVDQRGQPEDGQECENFAARILGPVDSRSRLLTFPRTRPAQNGEHDSGSIPEGQTLATASPPSFLRKAHVAGA
jgi:hypothetical protein